MINIGPHFTVPSNSSRFFADRIEAKNQPVGQIQLAWEESNPYIINSEHRSELIHYDSQYCTAVSAIGTEYTIPTLTYIDKVLHFVSTNPTVIDIGCGQGEFVSELQNRGINAIGFDPVVRTLIPYVHARYWDSSDSPGDLYVMRCVLPHIQNPWEFLSDIARSSPNALVLIEFQRLEWIIENRIWYQVSHDHVNLFTVSDFKERYEDVKFGTYSNGEWGWVLFNPSKVLTHKITAPAIHTRNLAEIFKDKEASLRNIAALGRTIIIWGGAGKGIVLAHALQSTGSLGFAIDADKHRWNLYLEGTGLEVLPPDDGLARMTSDGIILVCNPNHLRQVEEYVGGKFDVKMPCDFINR